MSKLDYVTIAIVIVCIAALGYLVYSVINLMGDPKPTPREQTTEVPADDFYEEGDNYTYDEEGEMMADETVRPGADSAALGYAEETPSDPEESAGQPTNFQEGTAADDYASAEEPETSAPDSYSGSYGEYLVLAGSYRYRHNAETEVNRLHNLGYDQASVTLFNRGAFATVMVDRFSSLNDAQALVRELKSQHGVEAYVHEKRGEN